MNAVDIFYILHGTVTIRTSFPFPYQGQEMAPKSFFRWKEIVGSVNFCLPLPEVEKEKEIKDKERIVGINGALLMIIIYIVKAAAGTVMMHLMLPLPFIWGAREMSSATVNYKLYLYIASNECKFKLSTSALGVLSPKEKKKKLGIW